MITPFPHYGAFTAYTPTLPKFYWNVYSQEQRIHDICAEMSKLICFIDSIVDTVNEQYETIEAINAQLNDKVKDAVYKYLDEAKETGELDPIIIAALARIKSGETYGTLDENGFAYVEGDE